MWCSSTWNTNTEGSTAGMVVLNTKSDGQTDRKKLGWLTLRTQFLTDVPVSPSHEVLGNHRQGMAGWLGVLYKMPACPLNVILNALDVNSSPNVHGRCVRFSTYPPLDSAPISIPSLFHAHLFSPPYCVSFTPFPPFKPLESLTSPLANIGSFGARFSSLMLMIACFLTSHAISWLSMWQTSQIAKPTNPSPFRRCGLTSTMTVSAVQYLCSPTPPMSSISNDLHKFDSGWYPDMFTLFHLLAFPHCLNYLVMCISLGARASGNR